MAGQAPAGVRFDWGRVGAARLAADGCAALVVVDVLSFSTSVAVAVGRGVRVHPFPWGDGQGPRGRRAREVEQAQAYAARTGAVVAAGRRAVTPEHPWSLSPAALARAPQVDDLVLPSPNGSAICAAAGTGGGSRHGGRHPVVLAACLRNAAAVAGWLVRQGYGTEQLPVGVVAAGERWPDGSLRPAVEDLLGAGAVLDGLRRAPTGGAGPPVGVLPMMSAAVPPSGAAAASAEGPVAVSVERQAGASAGGSAPLSVEAWVALAALVAVDDVPGEWLEVLRGCVSGRELVEDGFADDVCLAAERDVDTVVPVLRDGAFTAG